MIRSTAPTQRQELGDFVRSARERLLPSDIGLSLGGRRRTPGLRREEVAQLAGVSVTWYTWLEQGREMSVSPQALARLAAALRLGRAERAYMFGLAAKRDPEQAESETDHVPPAMLACVDIIASPAYVLDRSWTVLGWNAHAERLFLGWLDQPGDRNLLRYIFLHPTAPSLIRDYDNRARRVVAEFRADVSAHISDPAIYRLIDELSARSEPFKRCWHERIVLEREGGERTFDHPDDGYLCFEQVSFALAGHPDLKLAVLVPIRSEAAPR
ncbi:helix-turn-helix transcriptional regulator [Phyllobacterium phragmitis]